MPEIRQKEELESTYLCRHVDIGLSIYLKKDTVICMKAELFLMQIDWWSKWCSKPGSFTSKSLKSYILILFSDSCNHVLYSFDHNGVTTKYTVWVFVFSLFLANV